MEIKRPIDVYRDAGGSCNVGTEAEGAITEMTKIGDKLITLKENALYDLIMADDIDPERKNAGLPKMIQKKILDLGSSSELLSRTFLTTVLLFHPNFLDARINTSQVLFLTLEAVKELVTMEHEINSLVDIEKKLCDNYVNQPEDEKSFIIP